MSKTMNRLPAQNKPPETLPSQPSHRGQKTPKMANTLKQKAHKSHRVRFRTDDAQMDLDINNKEYSNLYDKYQKKDDTIESQREPPASSVGRKSEKSNVDKSQKSSPKKSQNKSPKRESSKGSSKWFVKGET